MQYRLIRTPDLYASDPSYLICKALVVGEDGIPDNGTIHVFLIERARISPGARLRVGTILEAGSDLIYDSEANALILEDFTIPKAASAVPVQEVPQTIPSDSRVPESENGWGDDDDIVSVVQEQTRQTPMTSPQRQPSIGATVRERQQAVLQAGDKIPLELLRSLRITAHSYNLVAKLVGAGGRPGPQDVRALVITNIINWAKTDNAEGAAPESLVEAAEAQLERVIKEYA